MGKLIYSNISPEAQALLDHWCDIRGEALIPQRGKFRPAAILRLLPGLMLLEYRDADSLIYRLVGTGIADRLGFDFTGANLFDHISSRQRVYARKRFDLMRKQPCGLFLHETLHSKYGTQVKVEIIYLPLLDRAGDVTQLVSLATVLERKERDPSFKAGTENMTAVAACFLDIGAGVPEELRPLHRVAG